MGSYSSSDLIDVLSGGSSFRQKVLPEAKDFTTWLTSAATPNQYSIMNRLIDYTKDALLSKAITDRNVMTGGLYG
jgi:hypothetical protein